jgi:hypothetical protein
MNLVFRLYTKSKQNISRIGTCAEKLDCLQHTLKVVAKFEQNKEVLILLR